MQTVFKTRDFTRIFGAAFIVGALFTLTACFDDNDDIMIERAAEDVSESIEELGDELDPNRTTGEKIGDAVQDTGDAIEDAAEDASN